ncbi:hypothetical protein AX15_000548 [Amanita polypyramis BW_CC]|nr:hypothetical protein AX15_000548 [Amanita polypyramis BW_CC]
MDKLPNEVMGLIFDEFTSAGADRDDEPPSATLVLSHVCHRWKDILTPSQWATVRIRHLNHAKVLNDIISRSGKYGLDIAVRLRHVNFNYFWTEDSETLKTKWRLYGLFHVLADNQARLSHLVVEAKQGVLAFFEEITLNRPLTPTHLSLIQSDRDVHMHCFIPRCFNLYYCTSLTLVHTSFVFREYLDLPWLRELRLSDIHTHDLLGWTYSEVVDEAGQYYYMAKTSHTGFASVELLSISNVNFHQKEQQISDFFSLFPNVLELELDCIDAELMLDILENDGTLMPCLQHGIADGIEVYFEGKA